MLFVMSEPPVYLARNGKMINADKQLRTFYSFVTSNSGQPVFSSEEGLQVTI
jgi:hypothetical protein